MDIITFIITKAYRWQTLVGSIIAFTAPFFVLIFAEKIRRQKERRDYLYFLYRVITDQINALTELRRVTSNFLEFKINRLLTDIKNNSKSMYCLNTVFFPRFSARSLPDDVNKKSSGSGYIDNKILEIYSFSKDLPHIVEDIRYQLRYTIEINIKIAISKLNPPEVQNNDYMINIAGFKKGVEDEMLGKNVPLYLKKLAETHIAVKEKISMNFFVWKIKFDPRWKFFVKKRDFIKARKDIIDNMDAYFEPAVKKQLEEIELNSMEK
ncbi:MAG: hypothetical protein Q8P06_00365 [Candidatus Azambacteria bacterium]|nr:hypothetical protein [Candidatus Azambacteria bacterium]